MIISVDNDGNQRDKGSRDPSMSDDGRYVAFLTGAELVPEDDNDHRDVYVYDTVSMETTRVSVATDGTQGNDDCGNDGLRGPAISGNGRYVAFDSNADNLVPDDNLDSDGGRDIFVRDMVSMETTRVTHDGFGDNDAGCRDPAISDDGRYMVFYSEADDLVADDTNNCDDVFMKDMSTGVITRVSVTANGGQGYEDSRDPQIADDGSYIVFDSDAILSAADLNGTVRRDVYGYDVSTGKTMLISDPRAGGDDLYRGSRDPAISADGELLAFTAWDDIVVSYDQNGDRADALGASALSGAVDGPILITRPDALPASIKAEITRLGATDAYVVGGTVAVSSAVMSELDMMLSGTVKRLSGPNRYVTANIMASEVIWLMGDDYDGTVLVATGENYADATGGAPLAAGFGWPVLLANPNEDIVLMPYEAEGAAILGGTAAVSSEVEAALQFEFGAKNAVRLAGDNRYETSAEVAVYGVENGLRWDGVGITTGSSFPDALTGGALLGRQGSVMLLTPSTSLSAPAANLLSANKMGIDTVYYFGGTVAVSDSVKAAAESVLGW